MADRRVAIRLGSEGKATVVADLNEIGTTGDAAFNRVARSAERAKKTADEAVANASRQFAKLEALLPGLTPGKLDTYAGVRDDVGKSAQASASVFGAAYAQMEARAEALLRAIDPVRDAQARYNATIGEARGLVAAGVMSLDDYVTVLRGEKAALDSVTAAHGRVGGSTSQTGRAFATAAPQIQDFFTQVSMGGNAMQAFVVQGGQVAGQMIYLEGRAGAVARFFMGPWGVALQVGLLALGPLVSKLFEGSDASQKAAKASEEHRKAVLELAAAQDKALQTAERRQALAAAEIKNELDLAVATRTRLQAELQAALVKEEVDRRRAQAPGTRGEIAALGAPVSAGRSADLERQIRDNAAEVAKLQKGFDLGFARLIGQRADADSTPEGSIRRRYEMLINRTTEELSGVANAPKLKAKLDEIYAARDRELKAIEKSTQARDAETLTAAQVSKMLRAELPGVAITSTTGGKHVKGSYHYRNQAVDFVPAGGMGSMTKADVRAIFESRGIDVVELLGPGDKGHSDHFHVAWTKGKLALDGFTDAAKRARDEKDRLDDAMKTIAGMIVKPEVGDGRDFQADLVADIDARRAVQQAKADYAAGVVVDQRERMTLAERELQLVAANDNVRDAEMGKLRIILDLRRQGIEAGSEDERQILENAEALDQVYAKLRQQQAVWSEIRSFGEGAIDRLFDPRSAESWGDRVKGILNDLKNEFIKLALLNPLKNALYGGDAPTLTGVLGKLGGLFGASKDIVEGDGSILPKGMGKAFPFATGTEYAPGGMALVGEEGSEIINLPRGSRVSTAAETRRLLSANDNGGGNSFHFDLRGAVVTEDILRQMNAIGENAAMRGAAGGAAIGQANGRAMAARRLGRGR